MSVDWVVCYDISNSRLRRRVAAALSAYGERLQESVYLVSCSAPQMQALLAELLTELDPSTPSLRAYPVCARDLADALTIGPQGLPSSRESVVI